MTHFTFVRIFCTFRDLEIVDSITTGDICNIFLLRKKCFSNQRKTIAQTHAERALDTSALGDILLLD